MERSIWARNFRISYNGVKYNIIQRTLYSQDKNSTTDFVILICFVPLLPTEFHFLTADSPSQYHLRKQK
jgi:hypothetical protein